MVTPSGNTFLAAQDENVKFSLSFFFFLPSALSPSFLPHYLLFSPLHYLSTSLSSPFFSPRFLSQPLLFPPPVLSLSLAPSLHSSILPLLCLPFLPSLSSSFLSSLPFYLFSLTPLSLPHFVPPLSLDPRTKGPWLSDSRTYTSGLSGLLALRL